MRRLLEQSFRRLVGTNATRPRGTCDARVIAVAANKGGVGKTTTSVHLASALARFCDQRVLLLDLDPQGHVHHSLESAIRQGGATLSSVLRAEDGDVVDATVATDVPRLDLTAADVQLGETEQLLAARIGRETLLRQALDTARTWYDVIVIDCPPSLGTLTINGLVAADEVLVPTEPAPLAVEGVGDLLDALTSVSRRLNPDLALTGILPTRVDGRATKMNERAFDALEALAPGAVLPVHIGVNAHLARTPEAGRDVFETAPRSRGARQYRDLAEHLHAVWSA